jgi:hypothetical protein
LPYENFSGFGSSSEFPALAQFSAIRQQSAVSKPIPGRLAARGDVFTPFRARCCMFFKTRNLPAGP